MKYKSFMIEMRINDIISAMCTYYKDQKRAIFLNNGDWYATDTGGLMPNQDALHKLYQAAQRFELP